MAPDGSIKFLARHSKDSRSSIESFDLGDRKSALNSSVQSTGSSHRPSVKIAIPADGSRSSKDSRVSVRMSGAVPLDNFQRMSVGRIFE